MSIGMYLVVTDPETLAALPMTLEGSGQLGPCAMSRIDPSGSIFRSEPRAYEDVGPLKRLDLGPKPNINGDAPTWAIAVWIEHSGEADAMANALTAPLRHVVQMVDLLRTKGFEPLLFQHKTGSFLPVPLQRQAIITHKQTWEKALCIDWQMLDLRGAEANMALVRRVFSARRGLCVKAKELEPGFITDEDIASRLYPPDTLVPNFRTMCVEAQARAHDAMTDAVVTVETSGLAEHAIALGQVWHVIWQETGLRDGRDTAVLRAPIDVIPGAFLQITAKSIDGLLTQTPEIYRAALRAKLNTSGLHA